MRSIRALCRVPAGILVSVAATTALSQQAGPRYDPLRIESDSQQGATLELRVQDAGRSRDIPLKVFLPRDNSAPAPVIMFSHGLGGSREGNAWLGEHWSARGYVVVFLQHPGSDASVWEDVRPAQRMAALRHAANAENFALRVGDVSAVLDQLERWNAKVSGSPLAGRLDLARIGMSGHSFGAMTTEAVGGEVHAVPGREPRSLSDGRIRSALMMSPSLPRQGSPATAFGRVSIPWLLMTGTRDTSPIGNATAESRREVFPALPPGDKYELVLDGAEHSAFGDRPLPGDSMPRNPNHHRVILAISTAFWDWTLKGRPEAGAWLKGSGPASVLATSDQWQAK